MPEETHRVDFPNGRGQTLAARLEMPAHAPLSYALFAHCFTCSKDILAASRVSRALAAEGVAVLRFDFTGLGHSQGEFGNENFSSNLGDLVAAADFLRSEYEAPRLLVGHSLGGAAVLAGASRIPEVEAIATIAAPSDPAHVAHLFDEKLEEIAADGEATVRLAGREFRIQKQFVEDLAEHNVAESLRAYRGALLVLHSPTDETVDVDHARRIFEMARHPKSFIGVDGADHLLTKKEDAVFVADLIASWAARYVCDGKAEEAKAREAKAGRVTVRDMGVKYHQEVTAGRHVFPADEPASLGGGDRGPTPYDLLLAALGTCTNMTLRMYANRKEWPLEGVLVRLDHARIHAKDCETCDSDEGTADSIRREIGLHGPLDEEQRARLMEIADRCPVHRTLTGQKEINTSRIEE